MHGSEKPLRARASEPGKGDDEACRACGAVALDTGLECSECGTDNYEAITGKPFGASAPQRAAVTVKVAMLTGPERMAAYNIADLAVHVALQRALIAKINEASAPHGVRVVGEE